MALYAMADTPIWLWSADASRILWGNAEAAAIFNAASSGALTGHTIDPKGSAALQIARLAGTLSHGGSPRLERLRGFGGRLGGAVMCACSRIALSDRTPAILIVATESAGPRLSTPDKAKRLLGSDSEPLALFAADGSLLAATSSARAYVGEARDLAALGVAGLATTALATGRADGDNKNGKLSISRLGTDSSSTLLVAFSGTTPASVAPTVADTKQASPPPAQDNSPPPAIVAPRPETKQPVEPPPAPSAEPSRRRQPLRFVWQIDNDGNFILGSDEFKKLIGPQTAAAIGGSWDDLAAKLALDPEGQVARAVASRETWSGITVTFPVDGGGGRLPVEMSGLPAFDRDRNFRGYRGFGICRDITRIGELSLTRRNGQPQAAAPRVEPPVFRDPAAVPSPPVNVVPFPSTTPADVISALTPGESKAFNEIGSRLSARLRGQDKDGLASDATTQAAGAQSEQTSARSSNELPGPAAPSVSVDHRPILDRLPIGVLVYRLDKLIYANRAFLDWTGYGNLRALEDAGGLDALFVEPNNGAPSDAGVAQSLSIATNQGDQVPVEARLFTSPWDGESALVLMLTGVGTGGGDYRRKTYETALRHAKAEVSEVREILDAAADGIVVIDSDAQVQSINSGAEKLFGYVSREVTGLPFTNLFAPQSQPDVAGALDEAQTPLGTRRGRDIIGQRREGGLIPLFMTLSPIHGEGDRVCAIFRDMTFWKKTEGELLNARRQAEKASSQKSDFLAKISHEIRTPLNAIIGFSEVMMQERFGPIGNERYRQYLKDIHTSGGHLVSLLNDLLDLSKIEAGKLELDFSAIDLNDLTQQSVALMQQQASRERIIIRTSLGEMLPAVTADARSVRQIVLNLLSNSIKFTGVGGQVIVSTARGDEGNVVLRVRDTGVGMSEQDIAVAMEPFRQLATSARWGSGGTGLGLPLTKALAEANRASFRIKSTVNTGTLVEVAFQPHRAAAE